MGVTAQDGKGLRRVAWALRKFDQAKDKPIINAIRRALTAAKTDAKGRFRKSGIGRRIWGKNPKGLDSFIKRDQVTKEGDVFHGSLRVHGLPGLIEQGGRTQAHDITSFVVRSSGKGSILGNKALGFFVRASGAASATGRVRATVKHPGGPIAKHANVAAAMEAIRPRIEADIRAALDAAAKEANDAAA